jgi:hypothetical protein
MVTPYVQTALAEKARAIENSIQQQFRNDD